jgi:hypothetical protein
MPPGHTDPGTLCPTIFRPTKQVKPAGFTHTTNDARTNLKLK